MKRLDEILSRHGSGVISAGTPDALPDAPDEGPGDPDCAVCHGAGFVRRERPVDDPRFGKAEPCDCVLAEAEDERRRRLERISNLGSLTRFTFGTLRREGRTGAGTGFAAAYDAARAFAAGPEGWLVFAGSSGTGKTHLAAAVANERIQLGQPVLFMSVPDLLDHLRAGYDATDEELRYERLFEQVRQAPLLILDDIDAAAPTDWAKEKLFQIVNGRYNEVLPTVFTCARRPEDLEDRRLSTRLCDEVVSRVFVLDGEAAAKSAYREIGGMSRDRLATMNFGNFDQRPPGLQREEQDSLESASQAAARYAESPSGWLLLQGPNGCGKTHLASAIANVALRAGRSVFFAVVPELLDHLRRSFAPDRAASYDDIFEDVRAVDLLVLDDLGAQVSSPWAQEKLYQIVNYRTLAGLPTVVTTDLGNDDLAEVYPRIWARIADPRVNAHVSILAPHYTLGETVRPRMTRRRR
ncbi:MAG: hypothetical protein Kow0010_22050 [Dehalococcoidia bacterium]